MTPMGPMNDSSLLLSGHPAKTAATDVIAGRWKAKVSEPPIHFLPGLGRGAYIMRLILHLIVLVLVTGQKSNFYCVYGRENIKGWRQIELYYLPCHGPG